jgi:glycerophosphoryl diester phosphodiesterase
LLNGARHMSSGIKVLGHRGYRAKYTENTLLAFGKAFEAGADGIECDVQKCADGSYIIIHDDKIDGVSKQSGKVAQMSLTDLKKVDIGNGQRIPELEEFLKFLPAGKFINIELKEETLTTADCPAICDMLLKYLDRKNLIVSSFEHALLPYFKERQVTIGMLLGEKHAGIGITNIIKGIIRIKPEYLNLPVDIFDLANKYIIYFILGSLRIFNMKIAFWTVNTDRQFDLIAGVSDIIITDNVSEILERVNQ